MKDAFIILLISIYLALVYHLILTSPYLPQYKASQHLRP